MFVSSVSMLEVPPTGIHLSMVSSVPNDNDKRIGVYKTWLHAAVPRRRELQAVLWEAR